MESLRMRIRMNEGIFMDTADERFCEPRPRTPAMKAVDEMFLARARNALNDAGFSALEFLSTNPGLSKVELAKLLNRGASAIGLIMAIYEEAVQGDAVRETAKDLLLRQIRYEFPDGWSSAGNVHPAIKVGSWRRMIKSYVPDPQCGRFASDIIRHLAIDHPPPEGWKPESQEDPLIEELFDRYWPES